MLYTCQIKKLRLSSFTSYSLILKRRDGCRWKPVEQHETDRDGIDNDRADSNGTDSDRTDQEDQSEPGENGSDRHY